MGFSQTYEHFHSESDVTQSSKLKFLDSAGRTDTLRDPSQSKHAQAERNAESQVMKSRAIGWPA